MSSVNYNSQRNYYLYFIAAFAAILCLLTLLFAKVGKSAIFEALTLCYRVIIPSIFTYMCLSNILINCGFDILSAKIFGRLFEKLFHLPKIYCCAYFISLICGYAQGANCVEMITKKENIPPEYAQKALILCSNPSPSFLIIAVGFYLNSQIKGAIIYLIAISVSLLYSIITRPKPYKDRIYVITDNKSDNIITSSISDAILSTINICGYILFFGVVCSYLKVFLLKIKASEILIGILFAIIELTNFSSLIKEYTLPLCLITFACIWSGTCVRLQIKSLAPSAYNFKSFTLGKLIQALIGTVAVLFLQIY